MIKSYLAGGAIPAYTAVKFDVVAGQVVAAAAAADKVIGVTMEVPAVAGERVDVMHMGEGKVVAGAAYAAGDPLVANAAGQAITAAPAAGANVRLIGFAREAAVALNDICEVHVAPGLMQG